MGYMGKKEGRVSIAKMRAERGSMLAEMKGGDRREMRD